MKLNLVKLVVSITVCQLAGVAGSMFTYPKISTWYASLNKPPFSPPNWLFGPVWITLFLLMGIALYIIWDKGLKERKAKIAVCVFAIQLVLNVLWSLLFFGMESPFYGFVDILLMWAAILATIISFYRTDKKAAVLMVPYILWVTIAAVLNYFILILN